VTPPPVPPFLFVDLYPFDLDDPRTKVIEDPPWPRALAHEKLTGVILKATDGMRYGFTRWFTRNFATLVQLLGERRGHTFLLGGYHYLQFLEDGSAQADVYVHALWEAGWGALDIVPIVDVEFGSKPGAANQKATTQQIIDTTSAFAERCRALTGRGVMLYGRGAMRDRSIQSKMGCDRVWDPSYTEKLVTNGIAGKLPNGKQAPWTSTTSPSGSTAVTATATPPRTTFRSPSKASGRSISASTSTARRSRPSSRCSVDSADRARSRQVRTPHQPAHAVRDREDRERRG
jgi:hypothetical protein